MKLRAHELHGVQSRVRPEGQALSATGSAHLDLIRAVAAMAVMWGHLREIFFVDFHDVLHRSKLLNIIYFIAGFGHQAVVVFFVLSGFLISSAVIRRYLSGTWSWRDYAIDRMSRLYVVLIPGLLFGLLWDQVGSSLFASTGLYSHPLDGFGPAIAQSRITVSTFLGNIFFLQTIAYPTFGSNGPLWSLANEFWYYVLFPIALFASLAWANKIIRRAIPLTVVFICISFFLRPKIMLGFVIWMMGCALVIAYSRWRMSKKGWLIYSPVSLLVLSACLTAARTRSSGVLGSDLVLGATFTLFLFGILHMEFRTPHVHYKRIAHCFAGFSYSLYVLHFPLLLFLRAWMTPAQRWQPDMAHLFYAVAVGLITLSFAWLVSIVTENKTSLVRSWMTDVIPRVPKIVLWQSPMAGGIPPNAAESAHHFSK